jgi:hypothetical protein
MDIGETLLGKNMHRIVELNQTQFGANRSLQAGSPSHVLNRTIPYNPSRKLLIFGVLIAVAQDFPFG